MSDKAQGQPISPDARSQIEIASGVATPEYIEPELDAEATEKKELMLKHAQQMLDLISQPTISERAQKILQHMPQEVQQKLQEFGVVYNKDGTERTPEDVKSQRDKIQSMFGEGGSIQLLPIALDKNGEQTQEYIDMDAAKVIQGTQYPDGLGPRSSLSYDLPKIYAFEIENKVRVLIETLIEPLAFLNKESHEKMVDFKRYVDYLTQSHQEIKSQFEDTVKLKQLIKEFQKINKQVYVEQNREFDDLRRKVSDNTQLLKVHEDRLIKVAEDKKIADAARLQMRNDIREFELLSADLVYQTKNQLLEAREAFQKDLEKCQEKIDSLRFETREMKGAHRQQKGAFRELQGKMGWTEEVLKEMQSVTEDLSPLFNQVRATDNYLHRHLPLQIQNQIYHSQKSLVSESPKLHLALLESTKKAVDHLLTLSEDEHMPFDKKVKEIPNLKFEIHSLTEKVKKSEDSDYGEEESGSESDSDNSDSDDSSDGSDASGVSEVSGSGSFPLARSASEQPRGVLKAMSSNGAVQMADTEPDEPEQASGQQLPGGQDKLQEKLKCQITLDTTIEGFEQNGGEVAFVGNMAKNLGIKQTQITVTGVRAGSVIVDYEITEDPSSGFSLAEIQQTQDEKLKNGEMDLGAPLKSHKASVDKLTALTESGRHRKKKVKKEKEPREKKTLSSKKEDPWALQAPSSARGAGKKKKSQTGDKEAVDLLAQRIASRLLKDEPFVNSLADILDGVAPEEAYYDSDAERAREKKERKAQKKQKKKEKKSGKRTDKSSEQASTIEPSEVLQGEADNKKARTSPFGDPKVEESQTSRPSRQVPPKVMSGIARRKAAAAKAGMNSTIHEQNEEDEEQNPEKTGPPKASFVRNRSPTVPSPGGAQAQRVNATPSPGPSSALQATASSGLGRRRASNEEAAATLASLKQEGDFTKLKVTRLEAQVQALLKKVSGLKSQVASLGGDSDEESGSQVDDYGEEDSALKSQPEGAGQASLDAPASSSGGGRVPRQDAKGRGSSAKLLGAQKQILDLRKKVGEILQKMDDEERKPRFAELIKTELRALSLNVGEIRQIQRSVALAEEHLELLKLESKKELKRLQRQNFQVTADFESQQRRMENLHLNVSEVELRVKLSETTMATIFKMLRIQYALLHQDEVDKQDIYLMGLKDATGLPGTNAPVAANLVPPTPADHAFDTGTTSLDTTQSPHDASVISQTTAEAGTGRQKQGHKEMKHWLAHGTPGSKGHQVLSIDKTCIHSMAQQQVPGLYKGFKMACLSYAPSKVTFENKVFDRNALVEAQGYLLYLALQHMRHLDFTQIEKSLLGVTMQDEARALGEDFIDRDAAQGIQTATGPVHAGDGMTFDELKQDSLTIVLSQGHNTESGDLLPQYGAPRQSRMLHDEQSPVPQDRGTDFLSSRTGATLMANPSSRMISLTKSKEYARLAANVPGVYSVEEGKKVLQDSEQQQAGVGDQAHDKYARNIQHLKLYQKQLQSQRGTSHGKSKGAGRRFEEPINAQEFASGPNLDSLNSRQSRKKSILYSQSLRKNNQTTEPDDLSVQQFSLGSAKQQRNLFVGQNNDTMKSNILTPRNPHVQIGIQSPNGYLSSELKAAKTPRRLAKMHGMMSQGKVDIFTPRNHGGMSNMSHNPGLLGNSLSSRPIAYNQFHAGLGSGQSLAENFYPNPNILSHNQLPSISMTRQSMQLPLQSMATPINAKPTPPVILINEKVHTIGNSLQNTPDLHIDTHYQKETGQGFDTINHVMELSKDGNQFTDLVKTELNSSRD